MISQLWNSILNNFKVFNRGIGARGQGGAIAPPPLFTESQFLHYKKSVFAPPLLGSFLRACYFQIWFSFSFSVDFESPRYQCGNNYNGWLYEPILRFPRACTRYSKGCYYHCQKSCGFGLGTWSIPHFSCRSRHLHGFTGNLHNYFNIQVCPSIRRSFPSQFSVTSLFKSY